MMTQEAEIEALVGGRGVIFHKDLKCITMIVKAVVLASEVFKKTPSQRLP